MTPTVGRLHRRSEAAAINADVAVIGFGKAGKTLAATLGRAGRHVVLVEQSAAMYGGTCINIGCVPTKSLVFQAESLGAAPSPAAYQAAVEHTGALTADLRATNYAMLEAIPTVDVIVGPAAFTDPHTIVVTPAAPGDDITITAETIVVGTGSEPRWPDIPGLRGNPIALTSTEMLSTPALPQHLVILGGGYIGLEFAAMYARYGSTVTILEQHDRILGHEDDDVADAVRHVLDEVGVTVVTSADVTAVEGSTIRYDVGGGAASVEADLILVAMGRKPATDGLGLDKAGIDTRPDGSIAVDEHLRTSQAHIFAVGDVNGGPQFTYISLDDHRIVLDQLTGSGARTTKDRQAVPYVLFTTPPLARVGLTERDARRNGRDIKVAAMPVVQMATVPRARIVGEPAGLMKVVVDADTDEILGAALLSYDSHEVINTVSLAIRHRISATELRDGIYTHPSMAEAFNQLLDALH